MTQEKQMSVLREALSSLLDLYHHGNGNPTKILGKAHDALLLTESAAIQPAGGGRVTTKWLREIAQEAGFVLNDLQQLVVPSPHYDATPYLRKLVKLYAAPVCTPVQAPDADAVIELVLKVVRLAHDAMDNTEDNGETKTWHTPDFDALSDAMDKLDALPDDRPGYVMGPAAKVAWALRAPAVQAAPVEVRGRCAECNVDLGYQSHWRDCPNFKASAPEVKQDASALPPLPVASARMYRLNGYQRASVSAGPGEPLFATDQVHAYVLADRAARSKSALPSIGNDAEFVGLALAWEGSCEMETQTETWNALINYIDARSPDPALTDEQRHEQNVEKLIASAPVAAPTEAPDGARDAERLERLYQMCMVEPFIAPIATKDAWIASLDKAIATTKANNE